MSQSSASGIVRNQETERKNQEAAIKKSGNRAADALRTGSITAVIGASFLMATSSIGPGFLNNTVIWTKNLMGMLLPMIVLCVVLDIVMHQQVWRTICWTGLRGPDVANRLKPGLGYILIALVVFTSFTANMGNVGGVALSLKIFFGNGLDTRIATIIGGVIAMMLYLSKDIKAAMDKLTTFLGGVMILTCFYVMFTCKPPVGEIPAYFSDRPFDMVTLLAILGGTAGAYLTLAGPHRLIDAGITGPENHDLVARSALMGSCVGACMRILMFLAAFGVLSTQAGLDAYDPSNPAASVFSVGAGTFGRYLFGIVLFSAATTSVVGCSFTCVSLLKSLSPFFDQKERACTLVWIFFSMTLMAFVGQPAKMMVLTGVLQGMILPYIILVMLLISHNKRIMGDSYKHPAYLTVLSIVCFALTLISAIRAVPNLANILR